MYLLYLDEFGHAGLWDPSNPKHCHHPLFGLAGVAIAGPRWRDLDRGFLRLKLSFYKSEIGKARITKGLRPERFEPKSLREGRDRRFAQHVLSLIGRCEGALFAFGREKPVNYSNHCDAAIYDTTVRGSLTQYEKYLRNHRGKSLGCGVVVLDQRNTKLNEAVLASSQALLFSHGPQSFERIMEAPLLVPSEWYHGVQIADIVGRVVSALYRWRVRNEQEYQWAEGKFGKDVDRLTALAGAWRTVFVKPWKKS